MGSAAPPSQVAANAVGPGVATIEVPRLVGALEGAVPEAAQQHVLTSTQDREVADAVAVDVEGVGTA